MGRWLFVGLVVRVCVDEWDQKFVKGEKRRPENGVRTVVSFHSWRADRTMPSVFRVAPATACGLGVAAREVLERVVKVRSDRVAAPPRMQRRTREVPREGANG
jgi:hypothetical protein